MSWNDAKEAFAEHFPNYEARASQDALAHQIEDALAAGSPLLAQAPTGVGKSFANLIPGIDHALLKNRPVCAATGTKALQDQYIHDLEMLKKIYYPELRYVVIKGRSNYVCRAKIAEMRKGKGEVAFNEEMLDELTQAAEEVDGDVERIDFRLSGTEKAAVTISSEECPGKKSCPFGSTCFAERVKTKATTAHIVVANHALVAVDAVLKAQGVPMLPPFSALIVDEGHEFEKYVSNALSTRVTERSITQLANQVSEFVLAHLPEAPEPTEEDDEDESEEEVDLDFEASIAGDIRAVVAQISAAAKLFFDKLRVVMSNRESKRETTVAITPSILLLIGEDLSNLLRAIGLLDGLLALAPAHTDEDALKRRRLRKRTASLDEKLRNVIMASFEDMVRWIELDTFRGRETIVLMQAPLEVAEFLRVAVWPWQPSILVSATLAIGDDFSYLAGRLGMPKGYRDFLCGSDFNYREQSLIYCPRDMPDPIKEPNEFRAAINLNIAELVRAADGRALLLFTSWTGLDSAHRALAPLIASMGHTVLKQEQGAGNNLALRDEFKADEHSVLFAVKSFFTGMDVQGDALRLLVVDKLPFPVPNVLFAAQCAAIDEKLGPQERFRKGSFMNRQVPEMIITLTQAAGRLIRSRSDRGLVAVLDPRVHSKPSYGRTTLRAIETAYPSPVVTDLREATAYLRSLEEVPD